MISDVGTWWLRRWLGMAGGFARRAVAVPAFGLARLTYAVSQGLLYLAGGTLRLTDLQDMSRRYWRTVDEEDNSLQGFEAWERQTYGQVVCARDGLLIVGCGTGRDLIPFVEAGHRVVGVEPCAERLATLRRTLRERGHSVELVEGFIEDVHLSGTYDVIIFSPYSYSYIPDSLRRITVLLDLARRLNSGGRIVLTYRKRTRSWTASGTMLARLGARLTRSGWSPQPYDVISLVDAGVVRYEHWFTAEELEDEARRAGLDVVSNECPDSMPVAVLRHR
jgi:SAM-dependent methyltransferase